MVLPLLRRRSILYIGAGIVVLLLWRIFLLTERKPFLMAVKNTPSSLHLQPEGQQLEPHLSRLLPWIPPGKSYQQTQLIFYGKPIMQAIRHICVQRKWKVTLILHDDAAGAQELQRLTSNPGVFTIVYTTSRAYHQPAIRHLANSTNALVSGIRYAYIITGPKKGQLLAFQAYFRKHSCTLEEVGIMPPSFILDKPESCLEFFHTAQANPDFWWILKPSRGYGGEGITIHRNMSHFNEKFAVCSKNRDQFVVQKYLTNLLLIEGRKFDVRAFMLVASTSPYILFYHEGYLRLSVEEFSLNGGLSVHLTNSHIQTQSRNFSVGRHYWSFGMFQNYLDSSRTVGQKRKENFVSRHLVPFIKRVGLFILQAGVCVITSPPKQLSFHVGGGGLFSRLHFLASEMCPLPLFLNHSICSRQKFYEL